MDKTLIKELIEKSFLKEEQKQQMIKELEEKGGSQEFFDSFDELLAQEIEEKKHKLDKVVEEFRQTSGNLEKEREEKIKDLNQRTEKILADLKIDDMDKKEKIWNEYYREIEKIYAEYEEQIKSIATKLRMSLI